MRQSDDDLGFVAAGHVGFREEGRRYRAARRRARQAVSPYWQGAGLRAYAGWKLSGAASLDELPGIRRQKVNVLDHRLLAVANAASVAALADLASTLISLSAVTLARRIGDLIARGEQIITEFGRDISVVEPGLPRDLRLSTDQVDVDEPAADERPAADNIALGI